MIHRRQLLAAPPLAASLKLLGTPAHAQPSQAARLVIGFPAGGGTDVCARQYADKMSGPYGRTVYVDNKTGAGGQIAVSAVKAAPADGSQFLLTAASILTIYPHTYRSLPYDVFKDVVPVAIVSSYDHCLAIGSALPSDVSDLRGFLAWCGKNPSAANYGSPAAGSMAHFVIDEIQRREKTPMRHIPYRGTAPAIVDLLGGNLSAASGPIGDFLPHVASGKLRILGTSGGRRSPFTPQIPTFSEQGIKLQASEWIGVFAPSATPKPILDKASSALETAARDPKLIAALASLGQEAGYAPAAKTAERLKEDFHLWAPIVKASGFTADS